MTGTMGLRGTTTERKRQKYHALRTCYPFIDDKAFSEYICLYSFPIGSVHNISRARLIFLNLIGNVMFGERDERFQVGTVLK